MKYLLIGLLRVYRAVISPLYGEVCRYYPSCSAYALEAVQVHGSIKGSWLAARRLARCHPWAAGGVDKVPPKKPARATRAGAGTADPDTAPSTASSTASSGVGPDLTPNHHQGA